MKYKIENNQLLFECGCTFKIDGNKLLFSADSHSLDFNVNFNCKKTYDNLSAGLTEGTFQITTQLGNSFCRKLRPNTLNHLSALGAILRPSCLDFKLEDGKSLTEHFVRRKNYEEDIPTFHPVVDNILKNTYGIMVYQEQSMEIVKQCAGFDLQEADILRRGIGHKEPETIAKCKKLFLDKSKTFGVLNDQQAETIFNQIEASQRYQFNASHSLSYSITSYITAYLKTHFPIQFYKNWLKNEKDRSQYANFINEAKQFNITTNPPNIQHLKNGFYNIKSDIYFGLQNIKGIKKTDLDKLAELLTQNEWNSSQLGATISWLQFLSNILEELSSNTVEGLIHGGALDCFEVCRAKMWDEYLKWRELTPVEKSLLSTEEVLSDLLQHITTKYESEYEQKIISYENKVEKRCQRNYRKALKPLPLPKISPRHEKIQKLLSLLVSPLYNIEDTIDSVVYHEEDLLGVALTRHETDAIKNCVETCSCLDIIVGFKGYATLRVKINEAKPYKCKRGMSEGQYMCFLEVSDLSGVLTNVVAFPAVYNEFKHLLTRNNLVFISGQRDKESFIISKAYNIE